MNNNSTNKQITILGVDIPENWKNSWNADTISIKDFSLNSLLENYEKIKTRYFGIKTWKCFNNVNCESLHELSNKEFTLHYKTSNEYINNYNGEFKKYVGNSINDMKNIIEFGNCAFYDLQSRMYSKNEIRKIRKKLYKINNKYFLGNLFPLIIDNLLYNDKKFSFYMVNCSCSWNQEYFEPDLHNLYNLDEAIKEFGIYNNIWKTILDDFRDYHLVKNGLDNVIKGLP